MNTHVNMTKWKNQTASVKTGGPFSKMWSPKNIKRTWGAQKHQCKTTAKSIWTNKEETIRENENDTIFAWGISETTARMFCPALGPTLQKDVEKIEMHSKMYLNETRFGNYAR